VGSIEEEKAGRIRARADTTIRSNDIWQNLLLVEHLDPSSIRAFADDRPLFLLDHHGSSSSGSPPSK